MLVACRSNINDLPYADTTKVAEMLRERAQSLIRNLHETMSSIWGRLVSIDAEARTVTIHQEFQGKDTFRSREQILTIQQKTALTSQVFCWSLNCTRRQKVAWRNCMRTLRLPSLIRVSRSKAMDFCRLFWPRR